MINTFHLFGPYEEREPEKHPSCSFIEICRAEGQYYYQKKASVHFLIMLLEHYFRFEPHWQRDNIVENIQNRAYKFIKMMQEAKPSEVITKYYMTEDSAKELFNIELDSEKSFSTIYSSLLHGERDFSICQHFMTKNSKRNHRSAGVVVPLWDCQYMMDFIYTFLYPTVAYLKIFKEEQIKELLKYQYEPLFRS